MLEIGEQVSKAVPELEVQVGFLELSDPPASLSLDHLVSKGVLDMSIVPLVLNPAGHSKSDVPAVVNYGKLKYPEVSFSYGRPIGIDQRALDIAHRRMIEHDSAGLPLLLGARGTSDPDANGDSYKVARLLAEANGSPYFEVGFSGITWPTVPDALAQLKAKGAERIVCFSWFVCTGLLLEQMRLDFTQFAIERDVDIVDSGYLGPDPALVPLILERHHEALGAQIRMNCDVCAYRMPFPGLEDRVGQAIGHGHSHLAVEHLESVGGGSVVESGHEHLH